MTLKAEFYEDFKEFYEIAIPFLLEKEIENSLQLMLLNSLKENIARYGDIPPILCAIYEDDNIKLVSLRTPPYNQVLSYTNDVKTIDTLVNALNKRKTELPGVLGFKEAVERFANLWCEIKSVSSRIAINERLYTLVEVSEETLGKRKFAKATESHESLILQWGREFILEAIPHRTSEMIERSLEQLKKAISEGNIFFLLDNNTPVSMVRRAGKSVNGIAINQVYTPPALRRKGYATECVAKLSNLLLEEGYEYCFLFTDLSNPTSNSIYQKIGYRPVIDVDEIHFINT
ncbi:MAG: GNAT family N-acetyltransferase [Promethearchaeota archaeon]|jgi:predicted GNAT family acetyltransferase